MDAALRALADDTRRQIIAMVWREELSAGEIASAFSMTRPAVSQHLATLRQCDLVSVRRAGTRRLYRANRRSLAQLRAALGLFWDDRLAGLTEAAEELERKARRR